ncbi:MAG: hypothetical protein OXH63_16720 [Gemmatimonadetes bacterium]|nr:hypothetical protein [Gemmatimonadota bacterium]
MSTAEPQMPLKVLIDGETVFDIRAFLGVYESKVFAIEAGDTFDIRVETGRNIPNPYISVPILRDLRDFTDVSGQVRAKVENVDTMRIVQPDAVPSGEPELVFAIMEHGFDGGMR